MAKRVNREQEQKLVELLSEAIKQQAPLTKEIIERPEGLAEVQLSIADRVDEILSWLDTATEALKSHQASKVELHKLARLEGLVKDGMTTLIYSAQVLMRQRLEIMHLRRQLEQVKK